MNSRSELSFFLILLAGTLLLLFWVFAPFLQALLLGAVAALVFHPLFSYLERLSKRKTLAALLTLVVLLVLVLAPLVYLGTQLFSEIRSLYGVITSDGYGAELEHIEQTANQYFGDWFSDPIEFDLPQFQAAIRSGVAWLALNAGAIVGGLFSVVFKLLIGVIAFYYFLKNGEGIRDEIIDLSPLTEARTKKIINRCEVTVRSVIEGSLVVAIVQGVLSGIGFAIFGVPQPVLWGAITVISALIPGVGTMLVMAPAIVYVFLTNNLTNTIGLLVWGFFLVGLADNILRPLFMQRYLVIHPLFIFLSVLGGISVFGPLGFIWGPIILSLFLILLELYKEIILERK
ncbi:MAG: AI-2E family transporter [Anaplasmataceae bacterium]|nr:AI-2E family transporter [Anaplasmataceae bacterium]